MRGANRPYDLKSFFLALLGLLSLAAAMMATGGFAFAIMIPLALFTLSNNKPEQLVFILLLAISTILANNYVMPKDMIYGISERALFVSLGFLLMTQVAGHKHPPTLTPLLGLLPYVGYMAIVSFKGWCPLISYLKLFLFVSIFMGYYAIAMRSTGKELDIRKLRGMLLAVASFFILGSLFAMRYGWAYLSAEELLKGPISGTDLFKGLTSHPNAFGCVLSAFALLLLTDMLFALQRFDILYVVNIVCAVFFIGRSGSRTGMGTFILALGFALYCFMKSRLIRGVWKGRVMQGALALMVVGGVYILASSAGREKIVRFAVKNRDEGADVVLSSENVLNSRQGQLDKGIENWRKSPLIGNGFQVSEDMKGFKVTNVSSILTAPVEKSVWLVAILEEGGIVGMGLFAFFLLMVFPKLIQRKAYIGSTLLFSVVCSNLGEFSFFSMSGGGGMQWGMVFIGLILDGQRLKYEARIQMFQVRRPF